MFRTNRTFDLAQGVKSKSLAVTKTVGGRYTSVLLHETVVVFHDLGKSTVELDNGGWDTPSTRLTINRSFEQIHGFGAGYFLFRSKRITYLQVPGAKPVPFEGRAKLKGYANA